jgi:hypothetical protein
VQNRDFRLEALVDFPDDALAAEVPITAHHIDAMMAVLQRCGVSRVSWAYYGDGHGGYFLPSMPVDTSAGPFSRWDLYARTIDGLGNPLRVAVEAAHRHGMELYAYYKPYETGVALVLPEGSPEARICGRLAHSGGRLAWLDRFVVDNPALRIRRRGDPASDMPTRPIHAIKLTKRDASPTRVTKDSLQLWASASNHRYQRLNVKFDCRDTVEPAPGKVRDVAGKLVTRAGDPVRTLTLSGFSLTEPYILVTTGFTEGPADFESTGTDMLVAMDSKGREIPGVFATGSTIWCEGQVDFRTWGLMFDHGFGRALLRLDEPNTSGKKGLIAFAPGRNEYLPGALCETEPRVREHWLSCVREMLDAGVDGVDFREENHSTHTDYPADYGYNAPVIDECQRRGSVDPVTVSQVRGDTYTEFLRQAKRLISSRGKRMRINLQADYYRPHPPADRLLAYPVNLDFQWRRWVEEGLMDEAIFRFFALPFDCIRDDPVSDEIIDHCRKRGLPITVNRYIHADSLPAEVRQVFGDGRFAGFILYETSSFLRLDADGQWSLTVPGIEELADDMRHP